MRGKKPGEEYDLRSCPVIGELFLTDKTSEKPLTGTDEMSTMFVEIAGSADVDRSGGLKSCAMYSYIWLSTT